jgi:UPF0716 protein FxsA
MWPLLFVAIIAVPLAELWVVLRVAEGIGLAATLALLLLVSIAGASLLKQQGLLAWRRLNTTLQRGEMPTGELIDAGLILLGGALLLTPGFLTDAVGLLLLLPPGRAAVKGLAGRLLARWARRRFDLRVVPPRVYPTDVTSSRRREAPDAPPVAADRPRPARVPPLRPGEDGSRDRG